MMTKYHFLNVCWRLFGLIIFVFSVHKGYSQEHIETYDEGNHVLKELDSLNLETQKSLNLREKKKDYPEVNAFIVVDKAPFPLNLDEVQKSIRYPDVVKKYELMGKVIIRVLVDTDGTVVDYRVIHSMHQLGTEAAVNQLPKLRFQPATLAGKNIPAWTNINFQCP